MSYNDLRRGRWSKPGREHLVTTVTLRRHPLFNDFACARIFIKQLAQLDEEDVCTWLAWVLMPDHFHGLLRLDGDADLSTVMRFLKCRSGNAIGRHRCKPGRIWQSNYHDRALRKEDDRVAAARYIVANPMRAGLVKRIGDYPHWDCVWL